MPHYCQFCWKFVLNPSKYWLFWSIANHRSDCRRCLKRGLLGARYRGGMENVSHMSTFWCRPHINVPPHFLRSYLKMGIWSYQHPDIRFFFFGNFTNVFQMNLVSVWLKYVAGRNFFLTENVYNICCRIPIYRCRRNSIFWLRL